MTDSLIRYFTVFESTNNLPRTIELGHGENADLIASFKDDGIPVNLSGYVARALYQPRSEWGTDNWFECPCEIVDNTAIAHWGDTYDNGDNAVKMFIHLLKDGKVAYPAIYQMKLFETPGFSPGSIVPIQKTLDFSEYNLVNAPWVPLSGNVTITGNLTMDDCDMKHKTTKTVTYKNLRLTNDTEIRYVGYIYLSYDETYAPNLLLTESEDVPIRISATLSTTGETETFDAVLTNPTYYSAYQEYAVKWDMYRNGTLIGDAIFRKIEGVDYPHTSSGMVYGETWIYGEYIADTVVPDVDVINNYIYDLTPFRKEMVSLFTDALYRELTLSTKYSPTPRFSEWTPVNYTFTVEWKENLNHWIFNFNGSEVGDSTGEWANPNATSLSFNYNGIQLEANRTRLDVGYVLGSQTDKPLQQMGDYVSASDFNTLSGTVSSKADISVVNELEEDVGTLSSNVTSLSGRVSTVESNITSTNNLIMNGIDREKTHFPNLTVTPLNRRMLDVDVTEYYSGNLTVQLPSNPGDNKYYSVLVVANAKSGTLYLSLAQPLLNTWQIVIEDGLNLSDILQVPGGKIGIFYLYQMSGHPSVAGSWGGIHIRREICQVITP